MPTLGTMGSTVATILELYDEADFGLAFTDVAECVQFIESLQAETEQDGTRKYPDIETGDKWTFAARWRMALTRTPAALRSR